MALCYNRVKISLVMCLNKHHAMNGYSRVEVKLHTFLTHIRRRCEIDHRETLKPLTHNGKNRMMYGPQNHSRSLRIEKINISLPCWKFGPASSTVVQGRRVVLLSSLLFL